MGASTGQLLLEPDRIRAPSLGVGRASKRRAAKPADRVDGSLLLTPEAKMQVRLRRRVRTRRSQWWANRCSWNWSRDKGRVKGKNNGFPCFGQKYCPRPGLNEGPLYASKDHLQVQDDTTTPHGPICCPILMLKLQLPSSPLPHTTRAQLSPRARPLPHHKSQIFRASRGALAFISGRSPSSKPHLFVTPDYSILARPTGVPRKLQVTFYAKNKSEAWFERVLDRTRVSVEHSPPLNCVSPSRVATK